MLEMLKKSYLQTLDESATNVNGVLGAFVFRKLNFKELPDAISTFQNTPASKPIRNWRKADFSTYY